MSAQVCAMLLVFALQASQIVCDIFYNDVSGFAGVSITITACVCVCLSPLPAYTVDSKGCLLDINCSIWSAGVRKPKAFETLPC